MNRNETVARALANRYFLYKYLWRAFAAEPDEAFLALVAQEQTPEQVALMLGEAGDALDAQAAAAAYAEAGEEGISRLQSEYTALFVGPGKLPAPVWESVYVTGRDLVFQESTLAVRYAYEDAGYQAAAYPREADDHLATELGFMAALAHDARVAHEAQDAEKLKVALANQQRFLAEHLNVWVGQFRDRLEREADAKIGPFYRSFARLLVAVCAIDAAALEELIAAV